MSRTPWMPLPVKRTMILVVLASMAVVVAAVAPGPVTVWAVVTPVVPDSFR